MSVRKKAPLPSPPPQAGEGAILPSPIDGRGVGGEGVAGHIPVTVQTDTHSHQGKPCQKGQVIAVTRAEAQFLLRCGVIQKIPARLKKEQDNG